jgi:uncharacterized protein (DUF924 family)
MNLEQQNKILSFWFSDYASSKWFVKDDEFDKYIRDNFLLLYEDLAQSFNINDVSTPSLALSYIIIFDQFSRNMFRDSKRAFSTDNIAIEIAKHAIKCKYDLSLINIQRKFLYMPFMHSESAEDQDMSVVLYSKLNNKLSLDYAIQHKKIIEKFNRFPHRNNILKRVSTLEELEFLKMPGSSF